MHLLYRILYECLSGVHSAMNLHENTNIYDNSHLRINPFVTNSFVWNY